MKNNHPRKKLTVTEICDRILVVAHNQDGLTLDVVPGKVAPDKSIYYPYQKLLRDGLISNEGHTRPLILHLTECGRKRAEKISAKGNGVAIQKKPSLVSLPNAGADMVSMHPRSLEFDPARFEELSQLCMEWAVLSERIAQLQGELLRKAA